MPCYIGAREDAPVLAPKRYLACMCRCHSVKQGGKRAPSKAHHKPRKGESSVTSPRLKRGSRLACGPAANLACSRNSPEEQVLQHVLCTHQKQYSEAVGISLMLMSQVEKWLKRAFLPGMRTFRPSAVAIAITSPGE